MTLIDRMLDRASQMGFQANESDMRKLLEDIRDDLPRSVYLAANAVPLERHLDGDRGKASFYVTDYEAQDIWAVMIDAALAET
jgi:hypothetical protein